jgi:hypothetical protein
VSEPIKAALPPDLDLGGNWVIEWDAVDPVTGATVTGVRVSDTSLFVAAAAVLPDSLGPYLLVQGGDVEPPDVPPVVPPPPPPTPTPPPPEPVPSPPPVTAGTYAQLVSALAPPQFEWARHIVCTTRAAFNTAYTNMRPGDWIDCRGIIFTGQVNCRRGLGALAKITYDSGCKFTGTAIGSQPSSCLEVTGAGFTQHLFARGATMTNPGGNGIHCQGGMHHCALDGPLIENMGADGVDWFGGAYGDTYSNFLRAEIANIGLQSPRFDPHAEKGTGLHGMNLQDNDRSAVRDNIVALNVRDCPQYGGSAIECGVVGGGAQPYRNQYYVKASRLRMVAKSQTAGNGVNLWGGPQHDNTFHVVEVEDIAGHAVHTDSSSATYSNVVVRQGTAARYCLNPRYAGQNPWMRRHGIVYAPGPFTPKP